MIIVCHVCSPEGGYSYTPIPIRVCVYVSPLLLYRFWYSWFFLINLMNTGIGQSKYFILQPFSPCLICLCSSLFDFNSIFIFFDWSRSCVIQSCATLTVHCLCSGFSSVSLHCTNILNETLQLSMEGKSLDRGTWESNVTQNQKEVKSTGKCYSWPSFSLEIRLSLISASAIANYNVTLRPRLSQLACLGFAGSFAQRKITPETVRSLLLVTILSFWKPRLKLKFSCSTLKNHWKKKTNKKQKEKEKRRKELKEN